MWYMPEDLIHMSLIGSYCILLILPARVLLSRCGRKYACCLWAAVFWNLVIPFDIRGGFSLFPGQMGDLFSAAQTAVSESIVVYGDDTETVLLSDGEETPLPGSGAAIRQSTDRADSFHLPVSAKPGRMWDAEAIWRRLPDVLRIVWLPGIFLIVLYNMAYAWRTQRRLSKDQWESWDEKNRIAEVPGLPAPFLWGIIRPVIFLPAGLKEEEKRCIVAHEKCHRRRKDSLTKLAFFAAASLHWFNPLVWLAWVLFCRDLEICCDEAVFVESGDISRKQYAQSLLKYAAEQNGYVVSSLTFGEPSAGMRIRHILRFRKKHIVLRSAAGLAAAAMVLGLVARPAAAGSAGTSGYPADTEAVARSEETEAEDLPGDTEDPAKEPAWEPEHRMGYQRPEVTHVIQGEHPNFTPGLRPEEELDMLARTALRELYDLTGYQVESCVYECVDLGTFYFGRTPEDLAHSRIFYTRTFGAEKGYDPLVITSMDYAGAGRVWFSDVQQLALPEHAEEMDSGELAVWFLEHSAVYQGEKIDHTEPLLEPWTEKVCTAEGTFYEIALEDGFIGVSSIYGPYPEGSVH